MASSTQIRMCHVDACSEPVPSGLAPQRVCLLHYLDQAFTKVDAALTHCQRGGELDSPTLNWLLAQGDFAVGLLAKNNAQSSEQRGRLLEFLLLLANVRECLRQRVDSNA